MLVSRLLLAALSDMAVQLRLNGTLSPNDVIAKKLSDLPTLVGSYSAREGDLPDGFKTLAGLELLPKPLIALYIQPPKNGALYTLNQAIRSYAGKASLDLVLGATRRLRSGEILIRCPFF